MSDDATPTDEDHAVPNPDEEVPMPDWAAMSSDDLVAEMIRLQKSLTKRTLSMNGLGVQPTRDIVASTKNDAMYEWIKGRFGPRAQAEIEVVFLRMMDEIVRLMIQEVMRDRQEKLVTPSAGLFLPGQNGAKLGLG